MSVREESISVVVPVFNSEGTVGDLVRRLSAVLLDLAPRYEIILVNDASSDATWDVLCSIRDEHPETVLVDLMRNFGQHNALLAGIRKAKHDIIVTLDDDLQNPPEEIPKLIDALKPGIDVVYGAPAQERHGFWRDLASQATKLALRKSMGVATAKKVSAFRAFRSELREAFADYRGPFVCIDVLLTWATTRFTAVTVRHDRRAVGTSHYSLGKLITHAFNMITGFTTLPLQVASIIGLLAAGFGLVLLVFVLVTFIIRGGVVPGFTFLAAVIVMFSGVQLMSLGMIGEYLARVYARSMGRPPYAMRSRTDRSEVVYDT